MRFEAAACCLLWCLWGLPFAHGQSVPDAELAQARRLAADYELAPDKREFLLRHAGSVSELVLVWVAHDLGNYSDPEVLSALRRLATHVQRNYELDPVAAQARQSLEKIEAGPLVALLQEAAPFHTKERTLRAMAIGKNDFARTRGLAYLLEEAEVRPQEAVPLLAELYPYERRARLLIMSHPVHARGAVKKGLRSDAPEVVEASIGLVADLRIEEALPDLLPFVGVPRETARDAKMRLGALSAMIAFGDAAVPLLERLLGDDADPLGQLDAIDALRAIGTASARTALRRGRDRGGAGGPGGALLREKIEQALQSMDGERE